MTSPARLTPHFTPHFTPLFTPYPISVVDELGVGPGYGPLIGPTLDGTSGDPGTVIGKVRLIVESLAAADGRVGLSELARRSGLAKPTVHRLCQELVAWGVVERAGAAFRLGRRLFELGQHVPGHRILRDAALPYMEELFVATRQTVHLAVVDGLEVLYLERITGRRSDRVPSQVAGRLPLHCTATGKCLLAFGPPALLEQAVERGLAPMTARSVVSPPVLRRELEQARVDGFAVEREEVAAGVMSVAAPVFAAGGRLTGALSITAAVRHVDVGRLAPTLLGATRALGQALGAVLERPGPTTSR